MTSIKSATDVSVVSAYPITRKMRLGDLREVLAKGIEDFRAMPTHSIFLVIIYPIVGILLLRLTFGYDMLPVVFPLTAGFTILGPFAAIGLYAVSRQREQGLSGSLEGIGALIIRRLWSIAVLGILVTLIFLTWLWAAMVIYRHTFGMWTPGSPREFTERLFTTTEGWELIVAGCGVGFLFALLSFTISVVSFPMLLDHDVGAMQAIITSVRAVSTNPIPMAAWGLIVAIALLSGSLPFLIGLTVVLPVLGHSTWHLYRKLVER